MSNDSSQLNRRNFILSGAAAGLAATAAGPVRAQAPAVHRGRSKPVVISSRNGITRLNGGEKNGVETAFRMITEGSDVLDALIAGVNIVELDPEDASVGYGGRPNAEGVVQLDACCMHGPKKQAGGVASLEGIRTPSTVAKAVMDFTDHHLLVGHGAQDFARSLGFTIEDDLNTERSRKLWLEWKRRVDPNHYLDPEQRTQAAHVAGMQMVNEGLIGADEYYGTINCSGVNASGDICSVTTTSGLSWKIPGRVGDSPILGAGLYVDDNYGAAGSTGRGEANVYGLCSYLVVEEMRRGAAPKDAGLTALRRIHENTVEKRLLNARGLPNFNVNFYVVNKAGEHAGVALYADPTESRYAVCDENGASLQPVEALFEGSSAA